MVASIKIMRWTGDIGSPTKSDVKDTNTRGSAADAHTVSGVSNPVQIPATGTNYSFWVSTRLNADVAPTGTINNIRWYTDGSNNLGIGVTCLGQQASSYVQATGSSGSGIQLSATNHSGLVGGDPTNVFAFTSSSPKSVAGSITASTGDFGNFMVFQYVVDPSAQPGVSGQETFTWKYDES